MTDPEKTVEQTISKTWALVSFGFGFVSRRFTFRSTGFQVARYDPRTRKEAAKHQQT
jgi:hypothetical protein